MSRSKRTTQPTQSRGDESPRLLDVKSIPEPMRRTLATLDITHVDQLRGVASVPDSRRALLDQLDVSDDALDNAIGKDGSTTVPAPPRFTLGALLPPPAARAAPAEKPSGAPAAAAPEIDAGGVAFFPDEGRLEIKGPVDGGHAWVIRWFDSRHMLFTGVSSWGPEFGIGGQFFLKYEDLERLVKEEGEACCGVELPAATLATPV